MNSSIVKRLFIESVITMQSNEDGDKEFDTFIVRPYHTVLRRKRRTLRNSDIKSAMQHHCLALPSHVHNYTILQLIFNLICQIKIIYI